MNLCLGGLLNVMCVTENTPHRITSWHTLTQFSTKTPFGSGPFFKTIFPKADILALRLKVLYEHN